MELSGLIVLSFSLFINHVWSQEDYGLAVTPQTSTAKVGDNPEFICAVKREAGFLIENPLRWERHGRDGTVDQISSLGNVESALQQEYNVELMTGTPGGMSFKLKLLQGLKNKYDGFFKCVLYNKQGSILDQKQVEVHVIKMFDKMEFQLGSNTLRNADNTASEVKLEAGQHKSLCKVEGSNPAATVTIFLNDAEQNGQVTTLKDADRTESPQAFNVQNAATLDLQLTDDGKILKCVAMVNNDENMKKTMAYRLTIFTVDPEITCGNKSAVSGDKFVELECRIKLPSVQCTDNFLWENGDTGEQYRISSNPNEMNYKVFCTALSADTVVTKFRIEQVGTSDFKTDYFLIYVNKHGSTKRAVAELNQDYTGAASSIQLCMYLLCSAMAAFRLLL